MNYSKKPLSIEEQIIKLEKRGLIISDKTIAAQYLQNISYYRLRAFTFPFQNNQDIEADHLFLRDDIDFNDIVDLYVFDRRLRNLVFNELEKIEVAVRTQLSNAPVLDVIRGAFVWHVKQNVQASEEECRQKEGCTCFWYRGH